MIRRSSLFLFIFFLLGNSGLGQTVGSNLDGVERGKFIPNKGQIADRNHQPRQDVLYQVEDKGIYLRENGITYVLSNLAEVSHEIHEEVEELWLDKGQFSSKTEQDLNQELLEKALFNRHQISMNFRNINADKKVVESGFSTDYLNFYLPQCPNGITEVRLMNQVTYEDIYNGIDAQFYGGEGNGLKYDLIVRPYTDPNQIKLEWQGADSVFVNNQGQLVILNQLETLYESLPKVYQMVEGNPVFIAAEYHVEMTPEGTFLVSFKLDDYDPSETLVIDPWVTNYGGGNNDYGVQVTTDRTGAIYLYGLTISVSAIAEDGFQPALGGGLDTYLARFEEDGTRTWATYYGGAASENTGNVVCDRDDFIYISGTSSSESGIAEDGFKNELTIDPFTGTGVDAFLVKFNSVGARVWGTYYGGASVDNGLGVTTDKDLNVYLSGLTNSADNIAIDGFDMTVAGNDAFLVKFNSAGDRIWGTYYGGGSNDLGESIAVDSLNNVYLGGITESFSGIAFDGHDMTIGGSVDDFLVKFSEDGDRLWATYCGGELGEGGALVAVDTAGNVYVTGSTSSFSGIASGGFQNDLAIGGFWNLDAFLMKYSPTGELLWGTYYGGNNFDYALSCAIDPKSNNVLICGDTYSTNLSVSSCAIQPLLIGLENVFLIQFFEDGTLFCASYFGISHEEDNTMALNGCYAYLTGTTPTGVATPGAHQETFGGVNDGYLAQIYVGSCGIEYPVTTIVSEHTDVPVCGDCIGSATVKVATEGCYGSMAFISYKWSTGLEIDQTTDTISSITDLCPGDYWVEVTYNCSEKDTVFFHIATEGISPITVNFSAPPVCLGEPTVFTNESVNDPPGPLTSFWIFGDDGTSSESDPEHTYAEPGVYEVTLVITNETGCQDSVTLNVEVYPTYFVELEADICVDSALVLPDGTTQEITESTVLSFNLETINGCDSTIALQIDVYPDYLWSDTIYANPYDQVVYHDGVTQIVIQSTQHTSQFTSAFGCDSVIITYVLVPVVDIYERYFLPPNIFSPGSDQANNTFFFPHAGVESFQCVIVNRWGVEVFRFNSITDAWDGTNIKTGKNCTDGVYFYTYAGSFSDGEVFEGQGTVQLVRE